MEDEDFLAPLRVPREPIGEQSRQTPTQLTDEDFLGPLRSPPVDRSPAARARTNVAAAIAEGRDLDQAARAARLYQTNARDALARGLTLENAQRDRQIAEAERSRTITNAMQDPFRAALLRDDTEALGELDDTFGPWRPLPRPPRPPAAPPPPRGPISAITSGARRGYAEAQTTVDVFDLALVQGRSFTSEERDRINETRQTLEALDRQRPDDFTPLWAVEIVGSAFGELGFTLQQAPLPVAAGAVAGGVIGAAATRTPAGAGAGFRIGGGLGLNLSLFYDGFRQETGAALSDYAGLRLSTGERLDDETVRGAALTVGVINGAIEAVADRILLNLSIPGLDRLTSRQGREVVQQLLQTEAGRNTLRRIAARSGQAATAEGFTEFVQSTVEMVVSGTIVAEAEGVDPLSSVSVGLGQALRQEGLARSAMAAVEGAIGGAGVAGTMAAVTAPLENYFTDREIRQQRAAAETARGRINTIEAAIKIAGRTRLVERDRQELAQFVNEATAESPVSTIYVSLQDVARLAEAQNTTVEDVVARLGATPEALASAEATGFNLEIATGDFIAAVTNTDLAAPAIEIIKTSPLLYSRREIDALDTDGREEALALAERYAIMAGNDLELMAELATIENDLNTQLAPIESQLASAVGEVIDTGGAAPQVGARAKIPYAKIAAGHYGVIARVLGITPREAFERYPLRIAGMNVGGMAQPPIEEGAPVEGGPASVRGRREIPVLPEPGTAEWDALLRSVAEKQARGERLTANERAIANFNREDTEELARILGRIREGKDLTPASQSFLRERGYDPATGQRVQDETLEQDETLAAGSGGQPRALYVPSLNEIRLGPDSDLSSFLHELGHHWLEINNKAALELLGIQQAGGTLTPEQQKFVDDVRAVLLEAAKRAGLKPGEGLPEGVVFQAQQEGYLGQDPIEAQEWLRAKAKGLDMSLEARMKRARAGGWDTDSSDLLAQEGDEDGAPTAGPAPGQDPLLWFASLSFEQRRSTHEAFARMTEIYFTTGEAPTPQLKDLFERFKDFMIQAYKSIEGALRALGEPLSPEIRQVMDRLIVGQINVQRAEEGLGFNPAFATKPAFMTDQEWRSYQELTAQATRDAQETLQKRSLRDLQWLSGAKSRELRKLQRQHAAERKVIREEVTAEVADKRVNKARRYLARGIHPEDGSTTNGPHKLSIPALREQFGDRLDWQSLGYGKYGLLSENGDHPESLATMLGYESAEEMINDLLTAPKQADEIQATVDLRMLERFGDLTSPAAMEKAANEAIHNALRGRALQAQHAALSKAIGKRALLRENAKAAAKIIVGRQRASKLNLKQAMAAERLAARRVMTAMRKNDLEAAATASRDQLLAFEITMETMRAQKAYDRARLLFRKVRAGKADDVAKRRNFDLVMTARGILAAFGEGSAKDAQKATDYLTALQEYDPNLYAGLLPMVQQAIANAEDISALSVNRLAELEEVIDGLWTLAREQRTIEINGRKIETEAALKELLAQIESLPKLRDEKDTGFAETPSDKQKFVAQILALPASSNLMEEWARTVDETFQRKTIGPFMRFIFLRVKNASVGYRNASANAYKKIEEIFSAHKNKLTRDPILAPLLVTDGKPFRFRNKAELLHAIAHSGNASNRRALLLGYGWGTLMPDGETVDDSAWRAQIDAFARDGILTKEDMDLVQSLWDLNESLKPAAQKAHRTVFGRYFNEITFEPITTPFGVYKGGYMPLVYDEIQSPEFAAKANLEASAASIASLEGQGSLFPSTKAGFAIERKKLETPPRVKLDLNLVKTHVDKVLRFSYLAPAIRDAAKLLNNRELKRAINAYDPKIIEYMIEPWLRRSMVQVVEKRGTDAFQNSGFWRFWQSVSSMSIMMFNVVNALLTPVGAPFMATASMRPRAILRAATINFAQYISSPKNTTEAVYNLSPNMRDRNYRYSQIAQQNIEQTLSPSPFKSMQDFFRNHTYFLQIAFQQPLEIAFWMAEYNDRLAQGTPHEDAVAFADSAITRIFSASNPEDVSSVEGETAMVRTITQFFNYMNRWGRVLGSEINQTLRSKMRVSGKANRLIYIIGLVYVGQVLASETLMALLRGALEDEDEDGYLDDWLAAMGYSLVKTPLAFVPYFGSVGVAVLNQANDKPYDDRVLTTPVTGTLERAGSVIGDYIWPWAGLFAGEDPQDIIDEMEEQMERRDQRKIILDVASFLTLITGLPFIVPARPAAFAAGVAEGDIEPTSDLDYARGLITGSVSEASKQ